MKPGFPPQSFVSRTTTHFALLPSVFTSNYKNRTLVWLRLPGDDDIIGFLTVHTYAASSFL
jgi:hypothetical protein